MPRSPRLKAKPKPNSQSRKIQFEAIGTTWSIELYIDITVDKWTQLQGAIHAKIEEFDQSYSRFRPDSLVTKMSRVAGEYQLPEDAQIMLDAYEKLYALSNGAVTPLIGQTLSDAGYDATYSLRAKLLEHPPTWSRVLDYAFPKLVLHQPALLDFGAVGKGYLVDIICALIEDHGCIAYCVDAGGDLRYRHSNQPLRVGLEHPRNTNQIIGVATIRGGSICGSAGNRRAWGDYHHIIDPVALASPRHIEAVWVTAADALAADALTTALFFVPVSTLIAEYDFEYVIYYENGTVVRSAGFSGELYGETL